MTTCEHDWQPCRYPVGCALFRCSLCGVWGVALVRAVIAYQFWIAEAA
jgi:hypothetical protein